MKTEIYKIKTDQAWNRLYNRLDNDRLLAKVDEGRSIRKQIFTMDQVRSSCRRFDRRRLGNFVLDDRF